MAWWKPKRRLGSEDYHGIALLSLVFAVVWTLASFGEKAFQFTSAIAVVWWLTAALTYWYSRRLAKDGR